MNAFSDSADLVITAPEPYGPHLAYVAAARMTLGVLIELVAGARRRFVLGAPYLSEDVLNVGVLAASVHAALSRGVVVELATTSKQILALPSALLRRREGGQLAVFCPTANIESDARLGSHAKFCISDSTAAYLGSANFTGPGLTGHLEMGVLVRGQLATAVSSFWDTLKELRVFAAV
jgi:phosphatidylserine/phosphatidylglycerophosphate/cardiolipin synthase-like enzyme